MCVTLAPARLSNTTLYAAEVNAGDGIVHVLGYQNKAQSLVRPPSSAHRGGRRVTDDWDWESPAPRPEPDEVLGGSGNAMLLPFPAKPGTMTHANVLETKQCPNILKDMAEAVRPRMRGAMLGGDAMSFGVIAKNVQVFDTGIYTVVLASDARDIPSALSRVPAEKRPALNPELFEAYAEWYPQWTMALCCFSNTDAVLADPLLWWYEPMRPDFLFAPALDCHTGRVPDLSEKVAVDHTVVVAARDPRYGVRVRYTDEIPGRIRPYIAENVIGEQFDAIMDNGDFVFRLKDLRQGEFRPKRLQPPGVRR